MKRLRTLRSPPEKALGAGHIRARRDYRQEVTAEASVEPHHTQPL